MPVERPTSLEWLPADRLKEHRVHLVTGQRGTGKTSLLRDLVYHMRDRFDYGVAFTPTEASAKMFREFMPPSLIHDSFKPKVLETLMQSQRDSGGDMSLGTAPSVFVLMDDCDSAVLECRAFRDLCLNGRFHKVTLLMSAAFNLDPVLCGSVDYCFCLRDIVMGNRIKLWKNFFSFFSLYHSYDAFSRAMTQATKDHRCIVLDNTTSSCAVLWYRAAPELPRFGACVPAILDDRAAHVRTPPEPAFVVRRRTFSHQLSKHASQAARDRGPVDAPTPH